MITRERISQTAEKTQAEVRKEIALLRERPDKLPEYDYFLSLLECGISPEALGQRTGREVIGLLCIQAPFELIHAAGFSPFKLFSGSVSASSFAAAGLPALMCPMLRSLLGLFMLDSNRGGGTWILPTTCDWIVKFPELLRLKDPEHSPKIHWVELPHLKETPRGERLWLEEVLRMRSFLEAESGKKIKRKALFDSIVIYNKVWEALSLLEEQRKRGRIAFPWFLVITNSFFLDRPERWTEAVNALVKALAENGSNTAEGDAATAGAARVFVAGSPVFFPGFKLPLLMEEAGLNAVGDDLCSSGRIFPGNVGLSDTSEFGMLSALAERYHHGCLCPTFADNDRRVNSIIAGAAGYRGVIYQVLKGCHPCDIESCSLEGTLKANGLKYLRLETDYTAEDSRNLLTRLEAFKQTLDYSES